MSKPKFIYALTIGKKRVGTVKTLKEAEAHVKSLPWNDPRAYGWKRIGGIK